MNIYKRIMLYVACVADIQRYLLKHVADIPTNVTQAINAIILNLLDQLKNDK